MFFFPKNKCPFILFFNDGPYPECVVQIGFFFLANGTASSAVAHSVSHGIWRTTTSYTGAKSPILKASFLYYLTRLAPTQSKVFWCILQNYVRFSLSLNRSKKVILCPNCSPCNAHMWAPSACSELTKFFLRPLELLEGNDA